MTNGGKRGYFYCFIMCFFSIIRENRLAYNDFLVNPEYRTSGGVIIFFFIPNKYHIGQLLMTFICQVY